MPAGLRTLAHLGMIERGFYSARRGFISLSLPLTDDDVDGFVEALSDVLAQDADLIRSTVSEAT